MPTLRDCQKSGCSLLHRLSMNAPFLQLSRPSLESLLKAIAEGRFSTNESGRISFPISPTALALAIASAQVQPLA